MIGEQFCLEKQIFVLCTAPVWASSERNALSMCLGHLLGPKSSVTASRAGSNGERALCRELEGEDISLRVTVL